LRQKELERKKQANARQDAMAGAMRPDGYSTK
jgi:hypothetical protein